MGTLLWGLITGILFGFFLQKGQALKYDRQLGMLRLQDFTILKVMISAILVGMAGVYLFVDLGLAKLSLKPTVLGANILGGLIFGLGWGMLGYCPGTAAGATGEGRTDALWGGIPGMLVGAGLYAEMYPHLKENLLEWRSLGKVSIPHLLGLNHWMVIAGAWMVALLIFSRRKKKNI